MKKIISLMLVTVLLIGVLRIGIFSLPVVNVSASNSTVTYYVSSNGSDETGDGSESNPYATIAKAEEEIDKVEAENRVISLLDNVSFTAAAHKNMVTIVGPGTLAFTETALLGPTTFDLKTSGSMRTGGYEVVLGTNFAFEEMPMQYFGGLNSHSGQREKVTINGCGSGMWVSALLRILPSSLNPRVSPGMDMVINGGHFWQFCISGESTNPSIYTGDFNVTINGGSHYNTFLFDGNNQEVATFQGALQFVFNNGAAQSILGDDILTKQASKGEWFMFAAKDDNNKLEITETAGTFKVNGTLQAKAVEKTSGAEYYSDKNGNLTVPEGKYDVTFADPIVEDDAEEVKYYVSANGSDKTGDGSKEKPFATIAKAEQEIDKIETNNRIISLLDNVDFTSAVHENMITIVGPGVLNFTKTSLLGPTTFDLKTSGNMYTGGYEVVLGSSFTFENMPWFYFGGLGSNPTQREKITINGSGAGQYVSALLRVLAADKTPRTSPGVDMVINNGHFWHLCITGDTAYPSVYTGDFNVTVNDGLFYEGILLDSGNKRVVTFKGALQFIFNNGADESILADSLLTKQATKGEWFLFAPKDGNNRLETTETAGTFKMKGTKRAKAVNKETGEIYYLDNNDCLTVPEGKYDISFYEAVHYGDVYSDGGINLIDLVSMKKRILNNSDYFLLADIDSNSKIDSADLIILKKHLIDAEKIVWENSYPIEIVDIEEITSGGADKQALDLKNIIKNNADTVNVTGNTYYISESGSSANSGKNMNSPITVDSIENLSLKSGDAVLFKRGDTFRLKNSITLVSGVSYGAYGNGEKPILSGSAKNYADKDVWSSEDGIIWKVSLPNAENVGSLFFNGEDKIGSRKYNKSEMMKNGDFYFDKNSKELYLYLSQYNPGLFFESIEISTLSFIFRSNNASNVIIENLSCRYVSVHGCSLIITTNFKIIGCEFKYIGGAYYSGETRYGNGIEFWASANNCLVDKCSFYQIYDAALTFQGNIINSYKNLTFTNNLIEYSSMNFEFWAADNNGNSDSVVMNNINFTDNILRFGGYGFGGMERPSKSDQAFVLAWHYGYKESNVSEFNIKNNIFDTAKCNFFYGTKIFALEKTDTTGNVTDYYNLINVSQNSYYQKAGSGFPIIVQRDKAGNQEEFENSIITVDKTPKSVKWIK